MFSEKELRHVASLSRIHLEEDEIQLLSKSLENILQYVNKLEKLDVSDIQPTSHAFALQNIFREDKIKPCLTQEEAMSFAVDKNRGFYKVPKVIE